MMDDFGTLQSSISSALVSTTRSASSLAGEDLPFHRSLDSQLASRLDKQNARLLSLATNLLGTATKDQESVRPPTLKDVDDVESNWRKVVDVVDSLLERADTALDEFTGAVRRFSPAVEAAGVRTPPRVSKIAAQLRAQDMQKPQTLFDVPPTNREEGPFKPLLLSKPHATVPLETESVTNDEDSQLQYPHPYQVEIEQYRYPSSMYTQSEPIPYHPFETTTATFVDSEKAVDEMLQELKQAKEIAIDLEHHDQRSYIGIVSLMQISTRDRDWIVDTLKPWRRKLQSLNEVFANPSIVKVLHGAYMDVVWLQRDLGLYLVGLFDTHYASRALNYPGGSLAYLLKRFADVDAQKQYQTADWRVRPLPQELFDYARSDTHYLLYIFDCMRNELIQRSDFTQADQEGDLIDRVLERSSETALQRYEHPVYDAELGQGPVGWFKLLARTPALLSKQQFSVFRAAHQWRDEVAREQDDSAHYVMPNHQIFTLAREMPASRAEVLGLAQPTTQTVRLRADELVGVIAKAKEDGKDGPEMMDILKQLDPHVHSAVVKKSTPALDYGVAAYVPKITATTNGNIESALPLRSTTSTFWGSAFESDSHDQRRALSTATSDIQFSVPMPPLTAEIFANPAEFASSTSVRPSDPEPEPVPARAEEENDDDVFVLKELGRKRKRVAEDGLATQNDEVAISGDEAEYARVKAERKKVKKEAKRAARFAATGDTNGAEEEEPFDYASAPSILNPPRETTDGGKHKKKETSFYAKSLDTPKGLPRAQKERAGKSMTYKS